MMDNATFRANMNAAAVAEGNMPTQAKQAQLHEFDDGSVFEGCMPVEVMARRGQDTLCYGPLKPVGNSCEKTIGCAKDAIEDSIERFAGANDILRYIVDHL